MVSQEYIYFIEKRFREYYIIDFITKYRNTIDNDQTKTDEEIEYLGIVEWENKKKIKLCIQFSTVSSIELEIDVPQTLNNDLMTEQSQNDVYSIRKNKNKRKLSDENEVFSEEFENYKTKLL